MDFGMQFFPDVGPAEKSGQQYFSECLRLTELCDGGGWSHVRTVEHYFERYGGYSPNPILFLAAAAAAHQEARLVTGAVLPAFNNPLKLAGEIGMLDAISRRPPRCRLRARLPAARILAASAFRRREPRPLPRRDGAGRLLLEEGERHLRGPLSFVYECHLAAAADAEAAAAILCRGIATPESFEFAGAGWPRVMAIPMAGGAMKELIAIYRQAGRRPAIRATAGDARVPHVLPRGSARSPGKSPAIRLTAICARWSMRPRIGPA